MHFSGACHRPCVISRCIWVADAGQDGKHSWRIPASFGGIREILEEIFPEWWQNFWAHIRQGMCVCVCDEVNDILFGSNDQWIPDMCVMCRGLMCCNLNDQAFSSFWILLIHKCIVSFPSFSHWTQMSVLQLKKHWTILGLSLEIYVTITPVNTRFNAMTAPTTETQKQCASRFRRYCSTVAFLIHFDLKLR